MISGTATDSNGRRITDGRRPFRIEASMVCGIQFATWLNRASKSIRSATGEPRRTHVRALHSQLTLGCCFVP